MSHAEDRSHGSFPIAAVASRNSETLAHFFDHVSAELDVGFVVIDPSLVTAECRLPVVLVDGPTSVRPGRIYVPHSSDASLSISGGVLSAHLVRAGKLDFFLRSLAIDQRDRAMAILLGGHENALGATVDIWAHGGTVLVVGAPGFEGEVDRVLQQQLLLAVASAREHTRANGSQRRRPDELARIVAILEQQRGHDFSQYKRAVVERRVTERVRACGARSLAEYADLITEEPVELDLLFHKLLIGVTSFFRDPAAFAMLAEKVVPELLSRASDQRPLRIWVPACCTGEEAYSIAILLLEAMEREGRTRPFQVFGTDLDGRAIGFARGGRYARGITSDVGSDRIARFFRPDGNGYRVSDELRRSVSFAVHDLLTDPPLAAIDLISCRNLLIYLETVQQQRSIAMFHHALRDDGFLFLGACETLGSGRSSFELVDYAARIYRKLPLAALN